MVTRKSFFILTAISFIPVLALIFVKAKPTSKIISGTGQIPGIYRGEYHGGTEILNVQPNGKFFQKFSVNEKIFFSNQGKWRLVGDEIFFEPFIALDYVPEDTATFSKLDYMKGEWVSNQDKIYFSEEFHYIITKVAKIPLK
jgi:hypothetical protein